MANKGFELTIKIRAVENPAVGGHQLVEKVVRGGGGQVAAKQLGGP